MPVCVKDNKSDTILFSQAMIDNNVRMKKNNRRIYYCLNDIGSNILNIKSSTINKMRLNIDESNRFDESESCYIIAYEAANIIKNSKSVKVKELFKTLRSVPQAPRQLKRATSKKSVKTPNVKSSTKKTSTKTKQKKVEDNIIIEDTKQTKPVKLVSDENKYKIIYLKKHECFRDSDGIEIFIIVRGKRRYDECYFCLKSVSSGFNIPNLKHTLLHKTSTYEPEIHYKILNLYVDRNGGKCLKGCIYLTYEGLLKTLFTTRNDKTKNFIGWSCSKLFSIQLGSDASKLELVDDILGVTANAVKTVLRKTEQIPSIYWFTIGHVKDFREIYNIGPEYDDDDIVSKVGKTKKYSKKNWRTSK